MSQKERYSIETARTLGGPGCLVSYHGSKHDLQVSIASALCLFGNCLQAYRIGEKFPGCQSTVGIKASDHDNNVSRFPVLDARDQRIVLELRAIDAPNVIARLFVPQLQLREEGFFASLMSIRCWSGSRARLYRSE